MSTEETIVLSEVLCETPEEYYVELCALDASSKEQVALRAKAREGFRSLCTLEGVQSFVVDLERSRLVIGTTSISLRNKEGSVHEIGEFTVVIDKKMKAFFCQNITRTIGGYHHPHIDGQGIMCMVTGRDEILVAITSGDLLRAVCLILVALNTISVNPYPSAALPYWPMRKELGA